MTWPAVVVVTMLAIAACGSAQPSLSTPAETCPLVTAPGPADEPNRNGLEPIDDTDIGGGRWRLCLTVPIVGAAETTAWCQWAPDRTAVLGFSGQSVTIGSVAYDSGLSIPTNEFVLAGYVPGPVVPSGEATEDGRSGYLAFHVVPVIDPEHGPPAGAEPRLVGVLSWQCGKPPPPR